MCEMDCKIFEIDAKLKEIEEEIEVMKNQLMGYCLFCQKDERIAKITMIGCKVSIEYPCGNVDNYNLQIGTGR